MGEAGLGPAEVGEKIAEHREHTMHQEPTGRDRIVTIIEAALLAMVALMAAWSGFASAKWSTESRLQLAPGERGENRGQPSRGRCSREQGVRLARVQCVVRCLHRRQHEGADVAERRFRPEFAVAFNAVDRSGSVQRRRCPTGADVHARVQAARAASKRKRSTRRPTSSPLWTAPESAEHADRYVRITVFLATVLFLVGISGHFKLRAARYGLIATAVVILLASVALLVTSPWPP